MATQRWQHARNTLAKRSQDMCDRLARTNMPVGCMVVRACPPTTATWRTQPSGLDRQTVKPIASLRPPRSSQSRAPASALRPITRSGLRGPERPHDGITNPPRMRPRRALSGPLPVPSPRVIGSRRGNVPSSLGSRLAPVAGMFRLP
eukprot:1176942-Prorocentrum_minimum.AAC.2